MPNYQLSKVYQIVCLTTGEKYIGSTTQKTLALRLAGHVRGFKSWKNGNDFVSSYPIIERGNYQIELLEAYPCNSKDELNAREGHHIRTIDCVNKYVAGRTHQEYREAHKAEIAERNRAYREAHKAEIAERHKAYNETHRTERAEHHKAYCQANKAEIAERNRAYREAHKAEIAAYNEAHKAETAERNKLYYQAHKAEIAERYRLKTTH